MARTAGLALLLAPLQACGGADVAPVEVPWPHSMAGYDAGLVDALEAAREEVLARPEDAGAWVRLGMLMEAHLMLELAEACYDEAVLLDGTRPRTWYRLAVMRGKNGDIEGALEAHERLSALDASYGPAWRRKGWLLLGAGRPAEASTAFERALAVAPQDTAAQLGLVEVDLERGDPAAALDRLGDLSGVVSANQALFHQLKGRALSRLGRFDEAEPELTLGRGARTGGADLWMREVNALKIGESALLLRADRMIETGQAAGAVEILRGLEERDPEDPRVFTRKGRALARLGDWPGAAAALSRASQLDPTDLGLARATASAMINAADEAGALAAAEALIEIDADQVEAHEFRAELLLQAGKAGEAAAAVAEARGRGLEDAGLEVMGGKAALELGDPEGALAAFERAIQLDGGDAEGWAGKALASLSLDAGEQAAAAAARLRELDPDHPLLPVLEESLAEGGGR
jgi:tetratricopeptide (TPR) repeat protein